MIVYKVHSKFSLKEIDWFLQLITPGDYKISFFQESPLFDFMKKNVIDTGEIVNDFSIEFTAPNSEKLISLICDERVTNMTLACDEYNIHYTSRQEFFVDIKFNSTSVESATNELVDILERLKKHTVFSFALKDKPFTREIINDFLEKNLTYSAPYTRWECILAGGETRIKSNSQYRRIELENGSLQTLITGIELTLPNIARQQDVYGCLNGFFDVLNKEKKYTVYIRDLKQLDQLLLPDSDLFKMKCSINSTNSIFDIEKLLTKNYSVKWHYKNWHSTLPFNHLEVKDIGGDYPEIHISFEDEENRDMFQEKFNNAIEWEVVYEE